jgi:hypothetical protein
MCFTRIGGKGGEKYPNSTFFSFARKFRYQYVDSICSKEDYMRRMK